MAKVNTYKYTVKEQVKNENNEMINTVEFRGETQEEAAMYVKMAGFTIVTYDGIKPEPKAPVYEYPSYETWCEQRGFSPS